MSCGYSPRAEFFERDGVAPFSKESEKQWLSAETLAADSHF
jgi:hypothetical protein